MAWRGWTSSTAWTRWDGIPSSGTSTTSNNTRRRSLFLRFPPLLLEPDRTYTVPMYLADRSLSQAIIGNRPRVQARVQLENLDPKTAVRLSVNGHRLEAEERAQDELRYSISPTQLQTGYNHFRILVPAGPAPRLKDILVSVLY